MIVLEGPELSLFPGIRVRVRSVRLYFGSANRFGITCQCSFLTSLSIKGFLDKLQVLEGHAKHLSFSSVQKSPHQQTTRHIPYPYCFKSIDIMRSNCNKKSGPFECISFSYFPWVAELNLINLYIEKIPDDIHNMQMLEKLDLSGNDFEDLPPSMIQLSKLKHVTMCNCRRLKALPELFLFQIEGD